MGPKRGLCPVPGGGGSKDGSCCFERAEEAGGGGLRAGSLKFVTKAAAITVVGRHRGGQPGAGRRRGRQLTGTRRRRQPHHCPTGDCADRPRPRRTSSRRAPTSTASSRRTQATTGDVDPRTDCRPQGHHRADVARHGDPAATPPAAQRRPPSALPRLRPGSAVPGAIGAEYERLGGAAGAVGPGHRRPACGLTGGGCLQTFTNGTIAWSAGTGAHLIDGALETGWLKYGGAKSYLGYPSPLPAGRRAAGWLPAEVPARQPVQRPRHRHLPRMGRNQRHL